MISEYEEFVRKDVLQDEYFKQSYLDREKSHLDAFTKQERKLIELEQKYYVDNGKPIPPELADRIKKLANIEASLVDYNNRLPVDVETVNKAYWDNYVKNENKTISELEALIPRSIKRQKKQPYSDVNIAIDDLKKQLVILDGSFVAGDTAALTQAKAAYEAKLQAMSTDPKLSIAKNTFDASLASQKIAFEELNTKLAKNNPWE